MPVIPIRTNLLILPAQPAGSPIGTVRAYGGTEVHLLSGTEVHLLSGDGSPMTEFLLTRKEDLQEGTRIEFWGYRGVVSIHKNGSYSATSDNGVMGTSLSFATDDRACWVSDGMFNLQSIRRLNLVP